MNGDDAGARASHGFLAISACALALYLFAFGLGFAPLRAAGARAPTASTRCSLVQKKPLFVGFATGMSLDSFETTAVSTRDIWHTVRDWLCADPAVLHATGAAVHGPRLHHALTQQHTLRLEEVQFDDPAGQRAHAVMLDTLTESAGPRGWHVHVEYTPADDIWQVTHAADRKLTLAPAR